MPGSIQLMDYGSFIVEAYYVSLTIKNGREGSRALTSLILSSLAIMAMKKPQETIPEAQSI